MLRSVAPARSPAGLALGLTLLVLPTVLSACRSEAPPPPPTDQTGHVDMGASGPAAVVPVLDSANTLFRSGDAEAALEQYRRVVELAPELPMGWFGIFMVETQRGNREAADSAFQQVMRLAPNMVPPPGSDAVHPPISHPDVPDGNR